MFQLALHYAYKTVKKVFEDKTSLLQYYKNDVEYFDEDKCKLLNAEIYPVTRVNQDGSAAVDTSGVEFLPKKVLDKDPQGKDKERLESLSNLSNRRFDQVKMLYNLCDHDFDKLLKLEGKMKKLGVFATPGTIESVNAVLHADCNSYDKVMEQLRKF